VRKSYPELFNDLSRLYLIRDILIAKLADGIEITLTEAERMVDDMIDNPELLDLMKLFDEFFYITSWYPERIVRSYRYRLELFVNKTIGLAEYGILLSLTKSELEQKLIDIKDRLLKNKQIFPELKRLIPLFLKQFKKRKEEHGYYE